VIVHPDLFFFFNDTATTEIYTLSLHDALPILPAAGWGDAVVGAQFTVVPGKEPQLNARPWAGPNPPESELVAPANSTAARSRLAAIAGAPTPPVRGAAALPFGRFLAADRPPEIVSVSK